MMDLYPNRRLDIDSRIYPSYHGLPQDAAESEEVAHILHLLSSLSIIRIITAHMNHAFYESMCAIAVHKIRGALCLSRVVCQSCWR